MTRSRREEKEGRREEKEGKRRLTQGFLCAARKKQKQLLKDLGVK